MSDLDHLTIFTRARAIEQGFAIPIEAMYVCILYRDGVDPEGMSFGALSELDLFIRENAPVTLFAQGAIDEDCTDLCLAVSEHGDAPLH